MTSSNMGGGVPPGIQFQAAFANKPIPKPGDPTKPATPESAMLELPNATVVMSQGAAESVRASVMPQIQKAGSSFNLDLSSIDKSTFEFLANGGLDSMMTAINAGIAEELPGMPLPASFPSMVAEKLIG
jgi:hypothetical protein